MLFISGRPAPDWRTLDARTDFDPSRAAGIVEIGLPDADALKLWNNLDPIEAGVDPYFQILGEGESDILMNRLLDQLFQNETENSSFLSLLLSYGEEEIRKLLKRYYFQTRTAKNGPALLTLNDYSPERSSRPASSPIGSAVLWI